NVLTAGFLRGTQRRTGIVSQHTEQRNMRTDFRSTKGMALVIALALALGGVIFAGAVEKLSGNNPSATLKLADPNSGPSRNSFAPVVKKALPAVVNVASSKVVKTGMSDMQQMD